MNKEYNFSKGERGKFYIEDATLNIPVYLDAETFQFIENIALKKKSNLTKVVNDLIKSNMKLVKVIE
jgi:hypothetical protein